MLLEVPVGEANFVTNSCQNVFEQTGLSFVVYTVEPSL